MRQETGISTSSNVTFPARGVQVIGTIIGATVIGLVVGGLARLIMMASALPPSG
jgi:hypothetical protein